MDCLGDECQACGEQGIIILPEENSEFDFIPYHKRPKNDGIFKYYTWLKQYNNSPFPGGLMEQPAAFIKVVDWCDLVNSKWSMYIKARNEATAKLNKQMGVMLGSK